MTKLTIFALALILTAGQALAQDGSNYDANGAWDPPGSNYAPQMQQPDTSWYNRFNATSTPFPEGSQQTPLTQFYNESHGFNADGSPQ